MQRSISKNLISIGVLWVQMARGRSQILNARGKQTIWTQPMKSGMDIALWHHCEDLNQWWEPSEFNHYTSMMSHQSTKNYHKICCKWKGDGVRFWIQEETGVYGQNLWSQGRISNIALWQHCEDSNQWWELTESTTTPAWCLIPQLRIIIIAFIRGNPYHLALIKCEVANLLALRLWYSSTVPYLFTFGSSGTIAVKHLVQGYNKLVLPMLLIRPPIRPSSNRIDY